MLLLLITAVHSYQCVGTNIASSVTTGDNDVLLAAGCTVNAMFTVALDSMSISSAISVVARDSFLGDGMNIFIHFQGATSVSAHEPYILSMTNMTLNGPVKVSGYFPPNSRLTFNNNVHWIRSNVHTSLGQNTNDFLAFMFSALYLRTVCLILINGSSVTSGWTPTSSGQFHYFVAVYGGYTFLSTSGVTMSRNTASLRSSVRFWYEMSTAYLYTGSFLDFDTNMMYFNNAEVYYAGTMALYFYIQEVSGNSQLLIRRNRMTLPGSMVQQQGTAYAMYFQTYMTVIGGAFSITNNYIEFNCTSSVYGFYHTNTISMTNARFEFNNNQVYLRTPSQGTAWYLGSQLYATAGVFQIVNNLLNVTADSQAYGIQFQAYVFAYSGALCNVDRNIIRLYSTNFVNAIYLFYYSYMYTSSKWTTSHNVVDAWSTSTAYGLYRYYSPYLSTGNMSVNNNTFNIVSQSSSCFGIQHYFQVSIIGSLLEMNDNTISCKTVQSFGTAVGFQMATGTTYIVSAGMWRMARNTFIVNSDVSGSGVFRIQSTLSMSGGFFEFVDNNLIGSGQGMKMVYFNAISLFSSSFVATGNDFATRGTAPFFVQTSTYMSTSTMFFSMNKAPHVAFYLIYLNNPPTQLSSPMLFCQNYLYGVWLRTYSDYVTDEWALYNCPSITIAPNCPRMTVTRSLPAPPSNGSTPAPTAPQNFTCFGANTISTEQLLTVPYVYVSGCTIATNITFDLPSLPTTGSMLQYFFGDGCYLVNSVNSYIHLRGSPFFFSRARAVNFTIQDCRLYGPLKFSGVLPAGSTIVVQRNEMRVYGTIHTKLQLPSTQYYVNIFLDTLTLRQSKLSIDLNTATDWFTSWSSGYEVSFVFQTRTMTVRTFAWLEVRRNLVIFDVSCSNRLYMEDSSLAVLSNATFLLGNNTFHSLGYTSMFLQSCITTMNTKRRYVVSNNTAYCANAYNSMNFLYFISSLTMTANASVSLEFNSFTTSPNTYTSIQGIYLPYITLDNANFTVFNNTLVMYCQSQIYGLYMTSTLTMTAAATFSMTRNYIYGNGYSTLYGFYNQAYLYLNAGTSFYFDDNTVSLQATSYTLYLLYIFYYHYHNPGSFYSMSRNTIIGRTSATVYCVYFQYPISMTGAVRFVDGNIFDIRTNAAIYGFYSPSYGIKSVLHV